MNDYVYRKEVGLKIKETLGYEFVNTRLLDLCFTHSSYLNEHATTGECEDYERLEFLGDAILSICVAKKLFEYKDVKLSEGQMSLYRSKLVCESKLFECATRLGLTSFILVGRSMANHSTLPVSIIADVVEALLAAIYLDSKSMDVVMDVVARMYPEPFVEIIDDVQIKDYKSMLQEHCQKSALDLPVYSVARLSGPDHNKTFLVEVTCKMLKDKCKGKGKSKKAAEQEAAKLALCAMNKEVVANEV